MCTDLEIINLCTNNFLSNLSSVGVPKDILILNAEKIKRVVNVVF